MPIDAPETAGTDSTQQQSAFPNLNNFLDRRGSNSPAAMMLKQRALSDREHMEGQRFTLDAQKLELEKVSELANIEKERMRISDSMETHRQTMQATKAISDLRPDDPDYDTKSLKIMADNPAASKDPTIQKALQHREDQFKTQTEAKGRLQDINTIHAEEFAGKYGVQVMYQDNGSPDFVGMEKLRQQKQADAMANPGLGVSPPDGMETSKIEVNPAGEETATFERPRATAKPLADPREFELQKTYGLTKDSLLNPIYKETGSMKPGDENGPTFEGHDTGGSHVRLTVTDGKGGNKQVIMPMDEYNRQVERAKMPFAQTPDEASKLDPGSKFIDPEGNIRMRP